MSNDKADGFVIEYKPDPLPEGWKPVYHWKFGRGPMTTDELWYDGDARPDSGAFFTTSPRRAASFETEAGADDIVAALSLEAGFLPGSLRTVPAPPCDCEDCKLEREEAEAKSKEKKDA